jgi:integration host factor subunit alpha
LTNRDLTPLTRAELVQVLRDRVGLSARDASRVLDTTLRVMTDHLAEAGRIQIAELGRFEVRHTPTRPGRNPKTGVAADVPARFRPCFNMSRSLRARMPQSWWEPGSNPRPRNKLVLHSAVPGQSGPDRPGPGSDPEGSDNEPEPQG